MFYPVVVNEKTSNAPIDKLLMAHFYSLIPAKMVRDWKILFLKGKPLYNDTLELMSEDLTTADCSYSVALVKKGRTEVLDETDLHEYMVRIAKNKKNYTNTHVC